MFKILTIMLVAVYLNSSVLSLKSGDVDATTEVTMKGLIHIKTADLSSYLTMNDGVESLKGMVSLNSNSLKSGDEDRDSNMYELLQTNFYPIVAFNFDNIEKVDNQYILNGVLNLNGVKRNIQSIATIKDLDKQLNIKGRFSILLTDFNMEPPSILFINVRNQIDVDYNLNYNIKE